MIGVNYSYTSDDVKQAYQTIAEQLFDKTRDLDEALNPAPKILVVAGVQGAGKTYLLEKNLLTSGKYSNYVRLYLPEYREHHPHYEAMKQHGPLHAYEHTEAFVRELSGEIFAHAYSNSYNIIMETALDSVEFAAFPMGAAGKGYQFEIHLIGCKIEFAHLATIKRALESLRGNVPERFVELSAIESSMSNAQTILNAFESACMQVSGSQITLYERGFGILKNRRIVCHSRCDALQTLIPQSIIDNDGMIITADNNNVRIERTPALNEPCSYNNYATLVNSSIATPEERGEAVKESHLALALMAEYEKQIPHAIYNDLYAYIIKYVVQG